MPKSRNGITTKQKLLVKEYVKTNGNGTQAALRVYDTKDPKVAGMIASREIAKDNVKEELQKLLQRDELSINKITGNLAGIAAQTPAKGFSGADVLDANKTILKLHGVLSDRKTVTTLNLNADLSRLSEHELRELRAKKKKETDAILELS